MLPTDQIFPSQTPERRFPDFEQWLNELSLFKQETQAELDEVSHLLNLALSGSRDIALQQGSVSSAPHEDPSESESSLASLKSKINQQLRGQRRDSNEATRGLEASPTSTGGSPGVTNNRDRDPQNQRAQPVKRSF
jgi:hypothetical protein